jgi:hypothetical protein
MFIFFGVLETDAYYSTDVIFLGIDGQLDFLALGIFDLKCLPRCGRVKYDID